MSKAPWTDKQVSNLNAFQSAGRMHPFTCPNRGDGNHPDENGDRGILRATGDGWRCAHCDYIQDWAYDFMEQPLPEWDVIGRVVAYSKQHKPGIACPHGVVGWCPECFNDFANSEELSP